MKLAWLTDIHLNFLNKKSREKFYQKILKTNCEIILISGDIAEATSIVSLLKEMVAYIQKPIYFVLGNHDYYHGQISEVREEMKIMTKIEKLLSWLPAIGMQDLDNNTILIGQDGWADGRLGDYINSPLALNDSYLIADLFQAKTLSKFELLDKMQELADADATQMKKDLLLAVQKNPKKIIVLTHVPPFREACLYNGKISDNNWLPYFSSKIMGDVLMEVAENNPSIEFLVFCGHTHGEAYYQPLINLIVKTGAAEYSRPQIEELNIIDSIAYK